MPVLLWLVARLLDLVLGRSEPFAYSSRTERAATAGDERQHDDDRSLAHDGVHAVRYRHGRRAA